MPTLLLSDLHLGARTRGDVLRTRPGALDLLVAAVRERRPERLVLLGDLLELRHGPAREAVDAARPVLEALGRALDAEAEVVVVPGNHDHAIIAPWLGRRALDGAPPLGLEERAGPDASPLAAALADAVGGGRLTVAYPGIRVRDDVYATHGHYMDRHVSVPRSERLAAGAMARFVVGDVPEHGATPDDYEAALAPLYAFLEGVARHSRNGMGLRGQRSAVSTWQKLNAKGRRPLSAYALAAAFPAAVALVNRFGLGPVDTDVTAAGLRRSGLVGMAEVCARLGIDAPWVVFGHTHRRGPGGNDDRDEWRAGTARLVNCGSWVHEPAFAPQRRATSPYWPGGLVEVGPDGPPALRDVLRDWQPS